ncbi:MAG TPA: glycoside hydrolase family 2 TIM barrel-domain containing protein, partial [Candidatus Bathyarchaeia archaeon]|nr:glycoside hydrolase family 2 TIM barrel-domain containing protein [Candidatus Bathyarchaeia archaeon]
LRSSHTGNHCPVGQIIPPDNAPDLLRRDLLYMKASGFNAVRFIAGVAHPWQLDMCDEIGLMVYEESLAGWLLGDSPKMAERFDFSTREMILRDRNHPSVVIWGLLNETQDGPVFRHAVDSLALVRSLDETRLVLLDSGRWDGQFNIGSASNPGSAAWECVWGIESPDFKPAAGTPWTWIGGYMKDAGDAHVYPQTPHPPEVEKAIRSLGTDMKPVFLSEYGIGSLMNAVRELRNYEQHGVNPELDDFKYFRATVDKLDADWKRFGMDGVYASTEEMLRDSQWLHCRQRLFGFNLIRSNPKICGYNLTGLLDHGFTGEGLWSFWREFKPGIMDALQDGWAPLRWCLFSAPMHGYADRPFQLEAVLANEDVLAPGDYSVTLRVISPVGLAWERKTSVTIPAPVEGEDGPLAVPVFAEAVSLDGPPGEYVFAATMESGGAPTGGRLTFHVSAPPTAAEPQRTVLVSGIDEKIQEWLKSHGIACEAFEGSSLDASRVILVGEPSGAEAELAGRVELLKRIARGSVAVFLTPQAFKRGNDPVGWLPLKNKGRVYDFPDWLYHKECIAKAHPVFEGLQPKGIMDWDYYGPVISHSFLEGQDTPADVMAVAIAICHSAPPGGYAAGVMIGAYPFGAGKFVFNTLNVLGNVDQHPAADRLLLNLVRYAGTALGRPPSELPADFDEQLKDIGYE